MKVLVDISAVVREKNYKLNVFSLVQRVARNSSLDVCWIWIAVARGVSIDRAAVSTGREREAVFQSEVKEAQQQRRWSLHEFRPPCKHAGCFVGENIYPPGVTSNEVRGRCAYTTSHRAGKKTNDATFD